VDVHPEASLTLIKKASNWISKRILGAPGKDQEEEKETDDQEDQDAIIEYQEETERQSQFTYPDAVSAPDTSLVATITNTNDQELVRQYLPDYLGVLKDKWKSKLSQKGYQNAHLVWRLFAEVNGGGFVQHLIPAPSTSARYVFLSILPNTCTRSHSDSSAFLILRQLYCQTFLRHISSLLRTTSPLLKSLKNSWKHAKAHESSSFKTLSLQRRIKKH
jgi:hypothetical protein